jgi:hypothetical protein
MRIAVAVAASAAVAVVVTLRVGVAVAVLAQAISWYLFVSASVSASLSPLVAGVLACVVWCAVLVLRTAPYCRLLTLGTVAGSCWVLLGAGLCGSCTSSSPCRLCC